MSWGPVASGLGGLVRLADAGGGVERDAGVCVPLSFGEVEADEGSLFVDDERAWVTCISSFGVSRGTGEMDLSAGLSRNGAPWPSLGVREVSPADIACVGWV